MENFDLRKYLAEGKLLKEDINSTLRDGGYDEIDDLNLLKTVEKEYREGMSAEDINDLTMRIEDREGGNIDFSENLLNEESIPSGWTEQDVDGRGFDEDEPDDEHILKIWSAPMEGWDEEHYDEVIIKSKHQKYYQDAYVSFGDYEEQGPFDTYKEALESAIGEMNAFKEDWDSEDDYIDEGKLLKETFNPFLDTEEGGYMREYLDDTAEEKELDLDYRDEFEEAFKIALSRLTADSPELDFNLIVQNKDSFF